MHHRPIAPLAPRPVRTLALALTLGAALAACADALVEALEKFDLWEKMFDPTVARSQASQFTRAAFLAGMRSEVQELVGEAA